MRTAKASIYYLLCYRLLPFWLFLLEREKGTKTMPSADKNKGKTFKVILASEEIPENPKKAHRVLEGIPYIYLSPKAFGELDII